MNLPTTPTPAQLAEAVTDLGRGHQAEVVGLGKPDPLLGAHLVTAARRIADRIAWDDVRLDDFTPHTDRSGYVWLPPAAHAYLADPSNRTWSFERWFTGFAEAMAACEPPAAEDLADAAGAGEQADQLSQQGFRPSRVHGGGLIVTRPADRDR